jgi:two-component system OmpR family sensor kinase
MGPSDEPLDMSLDGRPSIEALDGHVPAATLTRRQREIAGLLARGLSNAEIACELVLTTGTVANHVASILQRLRFDSRAEVAAWAVDHGLHGGQDRLLTTLEQLLDIEPVNLKQALDAAATLVAKALGAEKVDAFVYEEQTDTLVAVGTSKTPLAAKQRASGLDRQAIANGGRAVQVFLTGEPYIDGEVQHDQAELIGVRRGLDIRSHIAVPLGASGTCRGVLSAQTTRPDFFSERDLLFLQAVSRWVGSMAHRAELAERNAAAALEQGRRLAAEEMVTVLAHDLRNYLAPIRGWIDLLRKRAAREQHGANLHDTEELMRTVNRLGRMVSDLLDAARVDQGLFKISPQPVDLVELVGEAAAGLALPSTPIQVDGPPELRLAADPVRTRQAIENLLANAMQHAPSGTGVSVRVVHQHEGHQPSAIVLISDRGAGIEPALLPRIFDRFSRSPQSDGLGIGLFLARQIAEAHGGTLDVTSSSAGTHFRLALPAEPAH